jgi:drebrin-like protein
VQEKQAVPAPAEVVMVGPTAIAVYDYDAAEENELNFRTGDTITDIVFVSEDWWQGTLNGQVGLFPFNFVDLQQ